MKYPIVGPWSTEPDNAHWISHGLHCRIVRGPVGALNGYVGVPKGHPLFGAAYDDVNVDVHGGLTFAGYLPMDRKNWYLGFDCAHFMDFVPTMGSLGPLGDPSQYRTFDYVERECESLANQLVELPEELIRYEPADGSQDTDK